MTTVRSQHNIICSKTRHSAQCPQNACPSHNQTPLPFGEAYKLTQIHISMFYEKTDIHIIHKAYKMSLVSHVASWAWLWRRIELVANRVVWMFPPTSCCLLMQRITSAKLALGRTQTSLCEQCCRKARTRRIIIGIVEGVSGRAGFSPRPE